MMILPVQQLLHTRQVNEKGLSRSRQKSKGAASVFGFDRPQVLEHLARPEQLELDNRRFVGLEVLQDFRGERRGVQELVALVPLEFRLLPPGLEMLVLRELLVLDDFPGLAPV